MTKEDQLSETIGWFKNTVKCCYNCKSWTKDISLMGDYKYNACLAICGNPLTAWDTYCRNYSGFGKEENALTEIKLDENNNIVR